VVVGNIGALSVGLVRIAAALRAVAASYVRADSSIAAIANDATVSRPAIGAIDTNVPARSAIALMSAVAVSDTFVAPRASPLAAPSVGNDP
jgi:hypothetical protein